MPAGRRAVGNQLYVFSNNNGDQHHQGCMITAHGEQLLFGNTRNATFTVQAPASLSFFAPHGSILRTTFYNVGRGASRPNGVVETKAVGEQCYNYNLTKFQGYHCRALTGFTSFDKLIDLCYHGQRGLSYDDLETLVADPTVDVDVVTLRNRYWTWEMTLSRLLLQLRTAGYNYNQVFCSFCRGPAWISWGCGTPTHTF